MGNLECSYKDCELPRTKVWNLYPFHQDGVFSQLLTSGTKITSRYILSWELPTRIWNACCEGGHIANFILKGQIETINWSNLDIDVEGGPMFDRGIFFLNCIRQI